MTPHEYENLARIENQHWFYVGKRQIVRHWIDRVHPLKGEHLLVDCGAGTGTFAAELKNECRVIAVDDHQESLALARTRLDENQVRFGSCTQLPLDTGSVDVLTALDVMEHVEDDRSAMAEFARVTRPGGIVVVTVPALMSLWSDWDVSLHHFRRYTHKTLLALVPASFEVVHWNYVNVLVLPLVWLVRKARALRTKCFGRGSGARSEDSIPPRWMNECLRRVFVGLASQAGIRFPAGVGLLVVLRRRTP